MKMTFYLKDAKTDKFRRVSRKAAMDYMEKAHGKGEFEKRLEDVESFHSDKFDIVCSWLDFKIKKFCKEE